MNEIQRVVDELRFLLQRDVIEKSDQFANLVAEYGGHCHAANLRLRRCDACLKQGLRAEALHLAEAAPNLLDVVAVLDFGERDRMLETVAMYFFTPPEPLLHDVAAALNEAYAQQEPLQKLLDTHRLLALGRRPLSQRLPVLRALARLDLESPHWEADIRDMERARLAELEAESRAAAARSDLATLKALVAETQTGDWYEVIPPALLKNIKSRAGQTQRSGAQERMEELARQLYAAFSALDLATARRLRDEWNQHQRVAQLPPGDALCEHVGPVLDWLADEDRKLKSEQSYLKGVAEIERAVLDEDVTLEELQKVGAAFDRHQRSLPAALESRYRNRLATLQLAESRRRQLLIGAGAVVFLVVAGVFVTIAYTSHENEKTRRVVAAVDAFIADHKLDEARKLMEQHASMSTSDAWLAAQRKLIEAEQADRDRTAQLRAEMETVRESTEAVRIAAALTRARELARSADEKIEVGKLELAWQQRVSDETAAREQEFRNAVASASESLRALDVALGEPDMPDPERLDQMLSAAGDRVGKLRAARATVAKELGSQAELLDSRLNASRQAVADLGVKNKLLDKLTETVLMLPGMEPGEFKTGAFEATLHEFARALPGHPQAAAMKNAAVTSPLPAVAARHKLVARWKSVRPVIEKDIETRIREIRTFLTEYPVSPDRELIGQYELWLSALQRRFSDEGDPDEGMRQRLASLFGSRFIKDGHVLRDKSGRSYYLQEARTSPFGSVASFKYQVGFSNETKVQSLSPDELSTPTSIPPPQQKIAADVKSAIRDLGLENWRDYFLRLAETLRKDDQIDPFLRYLLLTKTLEFAGRGDQLLEEALAKVVKDLDDDELDKSVPWMDPFNTSADAARRRAVELLEKVPPLESIFTGAAKRQSKFERDVFKLRFSIGWLEKTSRGEWRCRTKWTSTEDQMLYVVSRPDANGARHWIELGRMRGQTLVVDPTIAQSVGEASVVFISTATVEPKSASLR